MDLNSRQYVVSLDMTRTGSIRESFEMRHNDDNELIIELRDSDGIIDLNASGVLNATLLVTRKDKVDIPLAGTITPEGRASFKLKRASLEKQGMVEAVAQFYFGEDSRISTPTLIFNVLRDPAAGNIGEEGDDKTLIEVVLKDGPIEIQKAIDAANAANQKIEEMDEAISTTKLNYRGYVENDAQLAALTGMEPYDTWRIAVSASNGNRSATARWDGTQWIITDVQDATIVNTLAVQLADKASKEHVEERIFEVNQGGAIDLSHKADITYVDKQVGKVRTPIQYYGGSEVYVDFPPTGYVADPAFADDRNGLTGKLWLFYLNTNTRYLMRVEVPYVGAKPSELGTPVATNLTGRINQLVNIDGVWYGGCVNKLYRFDRLDQNPTLVSTISSIGQNGDQEYVANLCVNRDNSGFWHAWYATYNGTNNGMRYATATSPNGPWTIDTGFWMIPTDIHSSLTWLRIYKVIQDKKGRLWAVAGAGRKWGGSANPGYDDAASVWVSPLNAMNNKPSQWQCVLDCPYYNDSLLGFPLRNNAYAPEFLEDDNGDWLLYVNTGKYGSERIVQLKPKKPSYWLINALDKDISLTNTYVPIEVTRAFIRDGMFKVTVSGVGMMFGLSPQYHTIHLQLVDLYASKVLVDYQFQTGASAYEVRPMPDMSTIINVEGWKVLQLQARWETGAGQTTPTDSRLRGVSLSIEKLD